MKTNHSFTLQTIQLELQYDTECPYVQVGYIPVQVLCTDIYMYSNCTSTVRPYMYGTSTEPVQYIPVLTVHLMGLRSSTCTARGYHVITCKFYLIDLFQFSSDDRIVTSSNPNA